MVEKHGLQCKGISYMTAIPTGSWFSKIYKPPSVFKILKSVSFDAKSGELHAIIGVADSGKTTLLEALSSGAGGNIGGITMLDKFMLTKSRFNKYCSYINYRNSYTDSLTVRCLLYYHARLYLSSMQTTLEIEHRISELMAMFDIIGYAHDKLEDLTISAKRRVMTVLGLLKDPLVTLIDDPTTDLSPLSAYQLIYALQFYAMKYNKIIIITLRNIRSDLYHLLGSVTFLFYGEVAYTGNIRNLPEHFKKAGYQCPNNENPAAYYLSLLTIDKENMERVIETQDIATKLITFRMELESDRANSSSSSSDSSIFNGAGTLLESSIYRTPTNLVMAILFRRILTLMSSSPTTTLGFIIALPIVAACLTVFSGPFVVPASLFFWKMTIFGYLLLQTVALFPIYSKSRLLTFLETNCYNQTVTLTVFTGIFMVFAIFQAFIFTGILLWSTNIDKLTEISTILTILSIFSYSIFTISARYLKSCSNVFITQFIILLIFFISGNGLTGVINGQGNGIIYYSSVISPFTYFNYLLSYQMRNSTRFEDCDGPNYMCRLATTLHTDLYPQSTYQPTDFTTNMVVMTTLSLTYLVLSMLIHLFEPSFQLQLHMKQY